MSLDAEYFKRAQERSSFKLVHKFDGKVEWAQAAINTFYSPLTLCICSVDLDKKNSSAKIGFLAITQSADQLPSPEGSHYPDKH